MDEEIKTQGKQWQKPELIVLVRSKPEEAVLSICKENARAGPTYPQNNASQNYCIKYTTDCNNYCQPTTNS